MDLNRYEVLIKALYQAKKPKDYRHIIALSEANFQKLQRLIPGISDARKNLKNSGGRPDLHLLLEEKSRHTAICTLTHIIENHGKKYHRPGVRFKVAFDTKTAEVLSVCQRTTLNAQHPYLALCSDLEARFERELFLEKWLDYCLEKYRGDDWR